MSALPLVAALVTFVTAACATAPPAPPPTVAAVAPAPAVTRIEPPPPEVFKSDDFIVVTAKAGDTAENLAAQHLGTPNKSWMIED